MFRHKDKNRTYLHNLRLASLLSFIAGIVNITGVLSVKALTTNVTGHFAFFAEDLFKENYSTAFGFLFFILSFLAGAFVSNFLTEIVLRKKASLSHVAPMLIEISILLFVGIFGNKLIQNFSNGESIACLLLFAMGIQNSMVTKISHSVVRTTHLTGLFTDLGIELSQLFFYKDELHFLQLKKSIYLRLIIILCFFSGCIGGGFIYNFWQLKVLLIAAGILIFALLYDNILYMIYISRRKIRK